MDPNWNRCLPYLPPSLNKGGASPPVQYIKYGENKEYALECEVAERRYAILQNENKFLAMQVIGLGEILKEVCGFKKKAYLLKRAGIDTPQKLYKEFVERGPAFLEWLIAVLEIRKNCHVLHALDTYWALTYYHYYCRDDTVLMEAFAKLSTD